MQNRNRFHSGSCSNLLDILDFGLENGYLGIRTLEYLEMAKQTDEMSLTRSELWRSNPGLLLSWEGLLWPLDMMEQSGDNHKGVIHFMMI